MGRNVNHSVFWLIFLMMVITACELRPKNPTVQAVYPSSNVVPENLLRMYVKFSQPMKTVGNLEKIKLLDEHGKEVKHVFFNNVHELWNGEQTQLTLILDPSRVKTGLEAHNALGRALKPGKKYTLLIEGLEDVAHQKMERPFKKEISVTEADLHPPDITEWDIIFPKADTQDVLKIVFPEMLDHNSLQQRLIITDLDKHPIKGGVTTEIQETEWHFRPDQQWETGEYILHVSTRLEDPSGNNLNGLFDHKIGSLKYKREGEIETVAFKIK